MSVTPAIYGYTAFYAMYFVCIVLYAGFKIFKRSKFVKLQEADLVWEKPAIDAYEASIEPPEWESC